MSNNVQKIARIRLAYSNKAPKAMAQIAKIAREYFKASFKKEGYDAGGSFKKWEARNPTFSGKRRQLLRNSGQLLNSIKSWSGRNIAVVYSGQKYARLHNDGGSITVSLKMRRFFWAKHYEALKAGNEADADIWKNMALKKAGSKIKMPARPFIYESRLLTDKIDRFIDQFIKTL